MEQQESFQKSFKAISIFGGVQIIQVFIALLKSKLIALLLGAGGMGLYSLYTSSTNMISTFSGLGLNFSAVRDISQAKDSNDNIKISKVISVFKTWIYYTGCLGSILTFIFSAQLSNLTFGNNSYSWAFSWLSITILLTALTNGNIAILQGTRQLKQMAKASIIGSISGLISSFPMYYWLGDEGIVPSMIIGAFVTVITTYYYSSKIPQKKIYLSSIETLSEGKGMVKLGITMMVASFIGTLSTYFLNAYILKKGGLADVGFYQAGISLTNQYVNLVFTAMSLDYFPRLAAICENNFKVTNLVNEQSFVVIMIIAPLLIALIIFAPIVVSILLTKEFIPIINFIRIACVGLLIKAVTYPMGYISFAKGDKKTFFILEGVFANAMTLASNILFYSCFGIIGFGFSLVFSNLIYLIIVTTTTYKLYNHRVDKYILKIFLIQFFLSFLTLLITLFIHNYLLYVFGFLLLTFSIMYSIIEINKKINLKTFIYSFIKRPNN